ncbi:MAG: hypothetical protein GX273_03820 [Bacteroidales bacterium]|nr:hypothetical protein [Bacteroidales bacterium]
MTGKFAGIIRKFTVAPIMAFIMLVILYLKDSSLFGGFTNFILSILFLTIFPLLAYPLQPFIKQYKNKGREGQRTLAMIFAVAGYIGGCLSGFLLHAPKSIRIIYLCYLLSGALITLFNKFLHLRASGHACGVTGPLIILMYFRMTAGYLGVPILAVVWWASLKIRRHTIWQLIGGSMISIVSLGIAVYM